MELAEVLIAANMTLTRSLDFDTVLAALLDHVAQLVPYDSGNVMVLDEGRLVIRAIRGYEGWTDPESVRRVILDPASPHMASLIATGESVLVADTASDPDWQALAATSYIRSWMGVPLIAGGRVIGLYSLDKAEAGFFTKEHLRLAEALAAPAAVATQNIRLYLQLSQRVADLERAQDAVRTSEARFRALAEATFEGICLHEEGRILECNSVYARMFGYEASELVGRSVLEVVAPESVEVVREHLRVPRDEPYEKNCQRKDGSRLTVEVMGRSIPYRGRPVRVAAIRDVTERRRAVEGLLESERRYRALFESNPFPMWVYDLETLRFLAVNDAAVEHYGYSREEFLGMTSKDIHPPEDLPALLEQGSLRPDRLGWAGVWRHRKKDGTRIDVEISSQELVFGERKARLVLAYDVTERRRLEEGLRQAQKMEAVGLLAGGVAHDFNNLLTVILGFGEQVLSHLDSHDPLRRKVEQICKAGERAAALTHQLLAFSRKQIVEARALDLNPVVAGVGRMLRRLIGEDIDIVVVPGEDLGRVRADAGQIEQVLMNLVVNARDAMPQGGRLGMETANVEVDDAAARARGVTPGRYVMLVVSDTGCGMGRDTLSRIFEPFFTTKEPGKGTGLGLATVYGIVQQSGGHVEVDSESGRGSTFRIYLPRVDALGESAAEDASESTPVGRETILLAEDEASVREIVRELLANRGYTVLEARHPGEALEIAGRYGGPIHLLITDVIMPHMNGVDLARRLGGVRPDVAVLFMSGYTDDAIAHGVLREGAFFLEKPFTSDALARKVREVLDRSPKPPSP